MTITVPIWLVFVVLIVQFVVLTVNLGFAVLEFRTSRRHVAVLEQSICRRRALIRTIEAELDDELATFDDAAEHDGRRIN